MTPLLPSLRASLVPETFPNLNDVQFSTESSTKRFMNLIRSFGIVWLLSIIGLLSSTFQSHAQCTSTLELDATLEAGESASASIYLEGDLTSFTVNLNFSGDNVSWAGDMLIYVYSPDGSCVGWGGYSYGVTNGCTDVGSGTGGGWEEEWYSEEPGLYTQLADATSWGLVGSGEWLVVVENDYFYSEGVTYELEFIFEGPCEVDCPDPEACNYVPEEEQVNASIAACLYPEDLYGIGFGCDGVCLGDEDEDGICDEEDNCFGHVDACGICNGTNIGGCIDQGACNFNSEAVCDDGSCLYPNECGECDGGSAMLNMTAALSGGETTSEYVYMTGQLNALEVQVEYTAENGSLISPTSLSLYVFAPDGSMALLSNLYWPGHWYNNNSPNLLDTVTINMADYGLHGAGNWVVAASNHTLYAVADNYSLSSNATWDLKFTFEGLSSCTVDCPDPNACNYVPAQDQINPNLDACMNAADIYPFYLFGAVVDCTGGCLNDEDDDGICDEMDWCVGPEGCTIPDACNFNCEAVCEDGSCFYTVDGCTDNNASNFNPAATCDNGSCFYDSLSPTDFCGPGTFWDATAMRCVAQPSADIDLSGCVGMSDLLELLSQYGTCPGEAWECGSTWTYQGHNYETVLIGGQCWFAENLRCEQYLNGDTIPSGLTDEEWINTSHGALAVYGEGYSSCFDYSPDFNGCNPSESLDKYGRLYNGHAVSDERGLCPTGWHVPTTADWNDLRDAVGGYTQGGILLKSPQGWHSGGNGTNLSGFNGQPGGVRWSGSGNFRNAGKNGSWHISGSGVNMGLRYSDSKFYLAGGHTVTHGASIRCLRDTE